MPERLLKNLLKLLKTRLFGGISRTFPVENRRFYKLFVGGFTSDGDESALYGQKLHNHKVGANIVRPFS